MNAKELAARLNCREYGTEITPDEIEEAIDADLIVVFGYSDDKVELRGVVDEEIWAFFGTKFLVCPEGVLRDWEDIRDDCTEAEAAEHFRRKAGPQAKVTAEWDRNDYSWYITADVPFEPFDVLKDSEKFCRGIVVAVADMKSPANGVSHAQ